MFVGAYVTLLAGLFWYMHFDTPELQTLARPYDWVWGLLCAIVLVIGTVCAAYGYILGIIGLSVEFIGIGLSVWLLIFGITQQQFCSVPLIIGLTISVAGFVIALVYHILGMIRIAKHGNSML